MKQHQPRYGTVAAWNLSSLGTLMAIFLLPLTVIRRHTVPENDYICIINEL